jgi:hypothetical protein
LKISQTFWENLHLEKYSSTQFGKRRGVSLVPWGGASAFFITSLVEEVWVQKTWERETHTHTNNMLMCIKQSLDEHTKQVGLGFRV